MIEIDITHPSLDKFPIYAAIGIPEVWRYAEERVMIYRHHGDGYAVEDNSSVLPGVTSQQLARLVTMGSEMPRPAWLRHVRAWAEGLPQTPAGEPDRV